MPSPAPLGLSLGMSDVSVHKQTIRQTTGVEGAGSVVPGPKAGPLEKSAPGVMEPGEAVSAPHVTGGDAPSATGHQQRTSAAKSLVGARMGEIVPLAETSASDSSVPIDLGEVAPLRDGSKRPTPMRVNAAAAETTIRYTTVQRPVDISPSNPNAMVRLFEAVAGGLQKDTEYTVQSIGVDGKKEDLQIGEAFPTAELKGRGKDAEIVLHERHHPAHSAFGRVLWSIGTWFRFPWTKFKQKVLGLGDPEKLNVHAVSNYISQLGRSGAFTVMRNGQPTDTLDISSLKITSDRFGRNIRIRLADDAKAASA